MNVSSAPDQTSSLGAMNANSSPRGLRALLIAFVVYAVVSAGFAQSAAGSAATATALANGITR